MAIKPAQLQHKAAELAKTTQPAVEIDPWADALTGSTLAPAFVRGPVVDVEKDVPASLRKLFEMSLSEYFQEVLINERPHPDGGMVNDGALGPETAKYREFDAGTVERATQFVNHARKYAKYRIGTDASKISGQISVRAFPVKDKDGKPTAVVRFAFTPLKKRDTRALPGTSPEVTNTAKVREWAKSQGMTTAEHGRLPNEIHLAFIKAHAQAPETGAPSA